MDIRLAHPNEVTAIVTLLDEAKAYIASYGSDQWQGDYPNTADIIDDIIGGRGYVALVDQQVAAYVALVKGPDEAYINIYDGKWLTTEQDYLAFHRLAVGEAFRRQGVAASFLEGLMDSQEAIDFRCDTHKDNQAMLGLLTKLGFAYCGKVMYEGERLAYQLIKTEKNRSEITYISEGGD